MAASSEPVVEGASPADQDKATLKKRGLTTEEIQALFLEVDRDNDGRISLEEFEELLKSLPLPTAKRSAPKLMSQMTGLRPPIHLKKPGFSSTAVNNRLHQVYSKKGVTYQQFETYVLQRDQALRDAFDRIDTSEDGLLDVDELARELTNQGVLVPRSKIEKIMQQLDTDQNGQIDFDEFRTALTFASPPTTIFEWQALLDSLSGLDLGDGASYAAEREKQDKHKSWATVLVAGGLAGTVSRTATAPFDRLKTLLQAGASIQGRKVTGIAGGMQAIYREGGVRAFFRGNGVNILKITPESATRWFVFEHAMNVIVGPTPQQRDAATAPQRFLAGACAGVVAQSAIYPLEVSKTRLSVTPPGSYSGILDCLTKTARREGPAALFRGLTPSLLGIVPYVGVDMSVYFTLKSYWSRTHSTLERPSTAVVLGMGAMSSICGQTIAYPLQLLRTRLQTVGSPGYTGPEYTGLSDCFRRIVSNDGFFGLYRGIGPNFLKAVPAASISFATYEFLMHLL